jgi:hypothetical protein
MSAPEFLTSNFHYNRYVIATDCQNVIDAFRTEVLSRNNPAWTESSQNLFKSPPDAAGRWFDALFTRIDATWLECRVRDQLGRTICTRRIAISPGGALMPVFTSQFYFLLDAGNGSLRGGILDQSPDPQGAHPCYVFGGGYYTTGNSNDSNHTVFRCFMWNYYNNNADAENRVTQYNNDTYGACYFTQNGSRLYRPVEFWAKSNMNYYQFAGRHYQAMLCPGDLMPFTRVRVPVDDQTGEFEVAQLTGAYYWRIMLRVG